MEINKGKFLRTVGWSTVGFGLYLVGISLKYTDESGYHNHVKTDDNIIDAEFTVMD